MIEQEHCTRSSYRAMLLEHAFVGDLLRSLWQCGCRHAEVLKSQTDDAGYDLVIECKGFTRHIQLKASHRNGKARSVNIHLGLGEKPSGCVLWLLFNPDTMMVGRYLWFGSEPGAKLPTLAAFKAAKHTKCNSSGHKTERPRLRVVPKARFIGLESIEDVVEKLFGLVAPNTSTENHGLRRQ